MLLGVVVGLLSACSQSCSYVLSRHYLLKYHNTLQLVVYSQFIMGIFGLVLYCVALPHAYYPIHMHSIFILICWMATFLLGQSCFYMALRAIEASRLSSLTGLKIIVLASFAVLFQQQQIHPVQWLAILLCSIAAMGMNFTGGRLPFKGCVWLALTLFGYAAADLLATELVLIAEGESVIFKALAATGAAYTALGLLTLPVLLKSKWNRRHCLDAIPFSVAWFLAMILLFICFGTLGAVFGNIIQASRGIISVLLGAFLLWLGFAHLEPKVGGKAWVRRLLMAMLMVIAMGLYAYGRT